MSTPPPPGYDSSPAWPPGPPPPGYGWPAYRPAGTNVLAILALVFCFVFPPAGLVLGILGVRETRRTRQDGYGLALAGAIVGGIFTAIMVLYLLLFVVLIAVVLGGG